MTIPEEFNDIRPYTPEELPAVYQELIADEEFKAVMAKVMPDVPFEMLAKQLLQCKTNLEFQKALVYPLLKSLVAKCGKGMEMNADSLTHRDKHHTFISNHRDIVLDSALLSVLLVDNGFDTTVEIAIGDNLLIRPWIKKIVRINKSFIVQRALTMRQMLQASATMSRYMHFAINHKNENIWMAQREGRAKDSNDLTQDSILKMLAMGGEGDIIDRLKDMNIVPLSISYEFDPCDYLKAKEFQQKRDNPDFKKSQQDDLDNMSIGIYGFKGHIHYHTAPCINEWLDTIDRSTPKTEIFGMIAKHIDKGIHSNYMLYPCNYIAMDELTGSDSSDKYTAEDKAFFEKYLAGQIAKIDLPNKDEAFLRERILTMYANPAINKAKAL
ncbi:MULTISPECIES: 1-acyl-sn-glycerol-3-phosphate acyltransferase [unclassified Bacteroides]|uniref:1-acyl-sn-glycerol-3-phosphate acyltransferase n=1 Tax=unclassified Bacteroides TaxID=2646097 RepID=UPI0004E17E45|nr:MULTISPECIES: 1-acyl-sn-glycerol-3-phosphate acyltransferase [unclassified Bacteroides]